MTGLAPAEILYGLPRPNRRRWQPLRAGILGLFRYDEQVFNFYRGRLLLRGNNGTGKSMALEVLLPYVLDAELSPERLSTFGSRTRTMHTWLIGHDENTDRTSARGYVWVEFGRVKDEGEEFFTAGAGLRATRASKSANAWYFTTAARVGKSVGQLNLGSAGAEALNPNQLAAALEALSAQGLGGQIHPTSRAHRDQVNRVLYRLDEHQFDALRNAMLNLRKPKLSDKLSEKKLAEVLRDALPPIDQVVTDELADGFERLDRHRDKVRKLSASEAALGRVFKAYRDYLHTLIGLRASAVVTGAELLEAKVATELALSKALADAKQEFDNAQRAKTDLATKVRLANVDIRAIEKSQLYEKGAQIEPLREKAVALRTAADSFDSQAQVLTEAAEKQEHRAGLATTAAQEAQEDRDAAGEMAERSALDLPKQELWALLVRLVHECEQHEAPRTHSSVAGQLLHAACGDMDHQLESLIQLMDRSKAATALLDAATARTNIAKDAVVEAQAAVLTADQVCQAQIDAFLTGVSDWTSRSPELTAGLPAPSEWALDTCERDVQVWLTEARRSRDRQLGAMAAELAKARPALAALPDRVEQVGADVQALQGLLTQLWHDAWQLRNARKSYAETVTRWIADLRELPLGLSAPDLLARPTPLLLTRRDVQTWVGKAFGARTRQLNDAATPLRNKVDQNEVARRDTKDELDNLTRGAVRVPESPRTRLADRIERPGAPFYMLVDFLNPEDNTACALLEAALEGSGLLDAWVSPDGSVLNDRDDRPLGDTFLTTAAKVVPDSLATALSPDPALADDAGPVPESVVQALLQRVRLVARARDRSDGDLTVGMDGSWTVGPLVGSYRKDTSEYVGAASRERRRRKRMAELTETLASLAEERAQLDEALAENEESVLRLNEEQDAVPDDVMCRDADTTVARTQTRFGHQAEVVAAAAIQYDVTMASTVQEANSAIAVVGAKAIGSASSGLETWRHTELATIRNTAGSMTTLVWEHAVDLLDSLAWPTDALARAETQSRLALSTLESAADVVDQRRQDLDTEAAAAPGHDMVTQARDDLQAKQADLNAGKRELSKAQETEKEQRAEAEGAKDAADTALRMAELTGQQDRLPALRQNLAQFRIDGNSWLGATALAVERATEAGQRTADAVAARQQAGATREQADAAIRAAVDAERQHKQLNDDMGRPYQELVAKHAELTTTIDRDNARLDGLTKQELTLTGDVQRLTAESKNAGEETSRARLALAGDGESFADLHRLHLVAAVDEVLAAVAPTLPVSYQNSPDRLPELTYWARQVAAKVSRPGTDRRHLDVAQTKIGTVRGEVESDLAGRVTLRERFDRGVVLVTGAWNGDERPLPATMQHVAAARKEAEELLRENESQLFERFLSDEIRLEVSNSLRAAELLLAQTNELMKAHPTGSGLRFELGWVPEPDSNMPDDIIEHLRKPAGMLWNSQRLKLIEFYQRRIHEERLKSDLTWRENLAQLLDYRRWFRFVLLCGRGTAELAPLSSKVHGQMSGGEKAIALHMPLFAAAATHCRASRITVTEADRNEPGCPRLILLDEVFAGVDAENRGELFDLITGLDLDLVATSESEQGLHPQLDGLAIYHLVADDALDGVLAVRSVWDGQEEHHMLEYDLEDGNV